MLEKKRRTKRKVKCNSQKRNQAFILTNTLFLYFIELLPNPLVKRF